MKIDTGDKATAVLELELFISLYIPFPDKFAHLMSARRSTRSRSRSRSRGRLEEAVGVVEVRQKRRASKGR